MDQFPEVSIAGGKVDPRLCIERPLWRFFHRYCRDFAGHCPIVWDIIDSSDPVSALFVVLSQKGDCAAARIGRSGG
jgi:hypothetical protein